MIITCMFKLFLFFLNDKTAKLKKNTKQLLHYNTSTYSISLICINYLISWIILKSLNYYSFIWSIFCTNALSFWFSFSLLFLFWLQSLTGNEDRNSEVKHILYEGVFARYLQFLPETHHGEVCLRTELFGVKLKPGKCRFYFLYYHDLPNGCCTFVGLFKVFFHKVSKWM